LYFKESFLALGFGLFLGYCVRLKVQFFFLNTIVQHKKTDLLVGLFFIEFDFFNVSSMIVIIGQGSIEAKHFIQCHGLDCLDGRRGGYRGFFRQVLAKELLSKIHCRSISGVVSDCICVYDDFVMYVTMTINAMHNRCFGPGGRARRLQDVGANLGSTCIEKYSFCSVLYHR
jgi:hypothetical protein